ncbi:unnamed protein product [Prorocentrum cordatum]|uniref:Sugar phosphate transporter domain-containing protein n=1 Tax=Prorocentrum cordatum TaxID=2364126 RepID=A0ABN9V3Z3_9DINO|nr:unnamed protein product [Polarella glacialis]
MASALHLLAQPDSAGCEKRSGHRHKHLGMKNRPAPAIVRAIVGRGPASADAGMPATELSAKGVRDSVELDTEGMNDSQVTAIKESLRASLSLVQGPPGTGKTSTALRIMRHWVRGSRDILAGRRTALLATSDSNIAVDNLVEGLSRTGVRVVRLGRPEASRPELLDYCADEIAAKACGVNKLSELQDAARARAREEVHRAVEMAEVVCCTSMGAGSGMLSDYTFPRVLMDEASQATEPSTIVPICKGCLQLVLLGDHCQLPPTVGSDLAAKEGLALSLFERLARAGVKPTLLQQQYRMHPAISEFPRQHFYAGELADGIGAEDRQTPNGFRWPDEKMPVGVVPVHGHEMSEGTSWLNEEEGRKVVDVLRGFLQGGLQTTEVGVVTPYGAQARLLRTLLKRVGIRTGRDLGGVEVNSVDSFQGREKDVIIMSTVRASDHGGIGFTSDWRRVNVAFTRARKPAQASERPCSCRSSLPGPETLAREGRTWAPWLRWAAARGLFCGPAPPLPPPSPGAAPVGLRALEARRGPSPPRGAQGRSRSPRRRGLAAADAAAAAADPQAAAVPAAARAPAAGGLPRARPERFHAPGRASGGAPAGLSGGGLHRGLPDGVGAGEREKLDGSDMEQQFIRSELGPFTKGISEAFVKAHVVRLPLLRFRPRPQTLGMYAFLFISVPEIQILKSMTIVMVLFFAWLLVNEKVSRLLVCSVLVIAGGVCLSAAYDNDSKVGGGHGVRNTVIGVVLMLLASTFEAAKTVISQVLMEKMSLFDGIYHSSPAFVLLAAVFVGCMEAKGLYHYEFNGTVAWLLAANAMATGVIVLSSFWFVKLAGALTLKVVTQARSIGLIMCSVFFFGEVCSAPQYVGYTLTLLGMGMFDYAKQVLKDAVAKAETTS